MSDTTIISEFDQWMRKVDRICTATCGLSIHDLADMPFYDWFEDEMTPREAAELALEEEGFPF